VLAPLRPAPFLARFAWAHSESAPVSARPLRDGLRGDGLSAPARAHETAQSSAPPLALSQALIIILFGCHTVRKVPALTSQQWTMRDDSRHSLHLRLRGVTRVRPCSARTEPTRGLRPPLTRREAPRWRSGMHGGFATLTTRLERMPVLPARPHSAALAARSTLHCASTSSSLNDCGPLT